MKRTFCSRGWQGAYFSLVDSMSIVELGASIRISGGPYAFYRRAFGPLVGFLTGWTDWLAQTATASFIAIVFAECVHRLGLLSKVPVSVVRTAILRVAPNMYNELSDANRALRCVAQIPLRKETMKLRLLNGQDVRVLLPMDNCIDIMRKAMLLVAEERTLQPLRSSLWHPNGQGLLSMMPGYTADPHWLGIKVVSVFPGNFGTARGSHQGMVLLFEPASGSPVAIADGREITAIRTAAATAVATDTLARSNAASLAILGYGEQACTHLQSLLIVRPFERILVWGRDFAKAQQFCKRAALLIRSHVEAVRSVRAAVEAADVICTTTASPEPVLEGKWLRSGQHLNVVGSSIPTTAEIDIDAVIRCRMFVDFKDSALELAGDFRRAREAGAIGEDHILGSLGDVLAGRIVGRTSDQDITMFKSLGMICEDLAAADFVLRESERRGVGTLVEW